jgi:hypothetical protein
MKVSKTLLQIGGALSAVFFLFHLFLGWQIHHWNMPVNIRALLEMFNGGGAVFILFLAVASLALTRDVLTTSLGRAVLGLGAATFLFRAIAETCISPVFHPVIFGTCLITGAFYLGSLVSVCRSATSTSNVQVRMA